MFPRERRCPDAATLGKRGTMPSRWTRLVHWVGGCLRALASGTPRAHVMHEAGACHRLTGQAIPCRSARTKSSKLLSRPHPMFAAARPLLSLMAAEIYVSADLKYGAKGAYYS